MSYGRSFGFRSFENIVRDGRFRVPVTGTPFKIGAAVVIDAATAGRMKAAAAAEKPRPLTGIVLFEHIQNKSDALTTSYDAPHDAVPLGQYAQIVHGVGTKVWFRNTVTKVLYDGRSQTGQTWFDTLPGLGDGIVPAANGKWAVAAGGATPETAWMFVEQVNPTTGLVECRFNF